MGRVKMRKASVVLNERGREGEGERTSVGVLSSAPSSPAVFAAPRPEAPTPPALPKSVATGATGDVMARRRLR